MGIRAALEAVMIERIGDQGNFAKNLVVFLNAGYLSVRQDGNLRSILEAGHATIHRGWNPTESDISTLLDIAESIVETVYLHDHRVRDLDKKVPKRPRPGRMPPSNL